MTDKEVLKHILDCANDFSCAIETTMPADIADPGPFVRKASTHIASIVVASGHTLDSDIVSLATAVVGLVLKLKYGPQIKAILAMEDNTDE